jgi:hypothetical protein
MSIVLLGSTSGSCTLQEQAVAGTTTLTLPTFDGTIGLLVSGTAVASTSGTSIDFTSIPAGVRRITVIFSGVSTNGSSNLLTQIGAGSFTTTGYLGSSSNIAGAAAASTAFTNGFAIRNTTGAASLFNGCITINFLTGNTWSAFGVLGQSDTACNTMTGGSVTISGTLDRVRLTTANGTDTFDAGSINILYE